MTDEERRSDGGDRTSLADGEVRIADDSERATVLREIADEIRGDSSASEHVAAILYRISDLYDPEEETTPEEIYRNVRNVLHVTERGTLERDP